MTYFLIWLAVAVVMNLGWFFVAKTDFERFRAHLFMTIWPITVVIVFLLWIYVSLCELTEET